MYDRPEFVIGRLFAAAPVVDRYGSSKLTTEHTATTSQLLNGFARAPFCRIILKVARRKTLRSIFGPANLTVPDLRQLWNISERYVPGTSLVKAKPSDSDALLMRDMANVALTII